MGERLKLSLESTIITAHQFGGEDELGEECDDLVDELPIID